MQLKGALRQALFALVPAIVCVLGVRAADSAEVVGRKAQDQPGSPQFVPLGVQSPGAAYDGQIIEKINFSGLSPQTDPKYLHDLIPLKEGKAFDRELVRQSIQKLHSTGRFADIRVEAERNTDGRLTVAFVTSDNFFVGNIRVEGAPSRPTAGQIANASKLSLGERFTADRMERALANIPQLMQENGYYRASVTAEQNPDPATQQVAIVFHVKAGPQARVGEVTAHCDPACSQREIQQIAKLHPGDPVSVQRTSNALDRLRKRYQKQYRLLAQVSIVEKTYRADNNTVNYRFEIVAGPKVIILAEGYKIKRSVLRRNVPVFEESAVDEDLLNEGRRNLLNYMQERGYFDATVGMKKETANENQELRITFVIDPGVRHKLIKLELSGNQYFPVDQLRTRLQVQQAGRLFANGRYNQKILNQDVKGLENLYHANGFQAVKVTANVVDDYEGRENELAVHLKIEEGPQTLVGSFRFVGNDTFTQQVLAPEINTAAGQPYSDYYISEDRDNLLNYYFNHGFPRATFEASAKPIAGDANRMDVTYTIHEGERVFVDHIYLSGLHYTRSYVAQRELQMDPGDPLSQIDMLQSQQRLYDLGIFNQVDTAVQNPNGNDSRKNVLVDMQEAKRYTFLYGVGLEFQTGQPTAIGTNQALGQTGVSPRVSLGVTRLNFLGRDHTITFKADVGSLQQRGLFSYVAPRIFGSARWRLQFSALYDNTLDVTTFTSQRLEGSIQAGQIINKRSTMDYSFTYRRVKATDIQISPAEIPLLSLPVRVGEPGLSYIRNTRDNDLETTKGMYITANAGVASSAFGSEADFSRLLIRHSSYHAFGKNRARERKFVIARSTSIGVENAFGNTAILPPGQPCPGVAQTTCAGVTVIPLAERFLSGGGNSHRGFGLNQAGPRDPVTGFPVGGSALFLNNLELRLPPASLPYFQENMSFVLFEDAGNVFTDGRNMLDSLLRWRQKDPQLCLQEATAKQCDFNYISHAVGIGVRYKTPIGPVRFDFGYNLNPPAFPSCEATPSIGQASSTYCKQNSNGSLLYFLPQRASHFNVYFSIGQSF